MTKLGVQTVLGFSCLAVSACGDDVAGSSSSLATSLVTLAEDVAEVLAFDSPSVPGPNNTYSYETVIDRDRVREPPVFLTPTPEYSALAFTDCSGWVSFAVNAVSPLHEAVLRSQRNLPEYNQTYPGGFTLDESRQPWARAFVLANYFAVDYAESTGFVRVEDFNELLPGDILAYGTGRYTDPSDPSLGRTGDTGHTLIVISPPSVISPSTPNYDGDGTLSPNAVNVISFMAVDASDIIHFDPDSRKNADGQYEKPADAPPDTRAGGIGSGGFWLSLDADGHVLQTRFSASDSYIPNTINNDEAKFTSAGRPLTTIDLNPNVLTDGYLVVERTPNVPDSFAGQSYGALEVDVLGEGGLRFVGGGRAVLSGNNAFTGDVIVESGVVSIEAASALSEADVYVDGGSIELREPAIAEGAWLLLRQGLAEGSVVLDFAGTNPIAGLFIDGERQPAGTWGSPGSNADYTSPLFTGAGLFDVADGPAR